MAPGYEVDRANKYGETPLYITCKSGYYEVVRLLLDNGAEVDRAASDYDGDPPAPADGEPEHFRFATPSRWRSPPPSPSAPKPKAVPTDSAKLAKHDVIAVRGKRATVPEPEPEPEPESEPETELLHRRCYWVALDVPAVFPNDYDCQKIYKIL